MAATERGPQLCSITIADEPDSWASAGFTVDRSGAVMLGSTLIHLTGGDGGFLGWSFGEAVEGADLDGIALLQSGPMTVQRRAKQEHPNGIASIDHIVISTPDCPGSIAVLESAGFAPRSTRTTERFGEPIRQTFFWAGDVILELIGPVDDSRVAQEPGFEASSLFGLALVAPDLARTAERLGDLMGSPKPAVQAQRLIAGLRGRSVGISVPIVVMSPHAAVPSA